MSSTFGNPIDLPLTGSLGVGMSVSGEFVLPRNHPLNPFKHRYHPDHDCNPPGECYEVTRSFTLTIGMDGADQPPDWGSSFWSGTYREEIQGLITQDYSDNSTLPNDHVAVEGTFELRRVSGVNRLNCSDNLGFPCE